jgi:glycogen(starch) synthase
MAEDRALRVAVVARAVAPIHGVGGLERSVGDLVRHLAARDVSVTLITPPARRSGVDPDAGVLTSPNIRLQPVPYVTFPFANRRGTTILDRSTSYLLFGRRAGRAAGVLASAGQVDIVHGYGAAVLGYATRPVPLPAPLVFNPQGLEEFGATLASQPWLKRAGYAPLRRAVRRCARAADCVLATDRALEATVRRHLRPAPGRMRTIPNGIDVAAADALAGPEAGTRMRQQHRIAADECLFVSVGRLEHNKGFDVLAAALGRLAADDGPLAKTPWRWVVVGAGPAQADLEAAIARAGIGTHVDLAGRVPDADLHAWYEAASLFVHPTRYEGSSLVTLEAMAHRRPIVATRAGGLPDKVRPGENGWLVEPDDAEALAGALREALLGRAALPAMGARSREIVEREFAWARIVDVQIALYEELLSRRKTG